MYHKLSFTETSLFYIYNFSLVSKRRFMSPENWLNKMSIFDINTNEYQKVFQYLSTMYVNLFTVRVNQFCVEATNYTSSDLITNSN